MIKVQQRYVASVQSPPAEFYQGWRPCIKWCQDHITEGWWFIGEGVFEFVNEADRTMFLLRWS